MSDASLESWVDETSTTGLLVQIEGRTVVEIDRPTATPGWTGLDGAPNLGDPQGEIGLPFAPTPDGRMRHDIASGQKSIVAVLVAIGAERGLLQLDDPVSAHLGPGWSRAAPNEETAITIGHLLTMTSGLGDDLSYVAPPGTRWHYSLGPTWHQLKPLLEAATGDTLQDLTDNWLAGPIGMRESTWINRPGMTYLDGRPIEALLTSARDLVRFGNLILNNGTVEGCEILSADSLAQLLTPSQDLNRAYGLLWWLNGQRPFLRPSMEEPVDSVLIPDAPADTVAALGAMGQFCLVTPSRRAVIVRLGSAPRGDWTGGDLPNELWQSLDQTLFS